MSRNTQREKQELRLAQAKEEFETLLRKCLPECARGRWGLFGQHARAMGEEFEKRYYSWPEAERVVALSAELTALREELADTTDFPLLERFLYYRSLSGPQVLGEPKLALEFLQVLKREELAGKTPSPRAFWT